VDAAKFMSRELTALQELDNDIEEKKRCMKEEEALVKQLTEARILFAHSVFEDAFIGDALMPRLQHLPGFPVSVRSVYYLIYYCFIYFLLTGRSGKVSIDIEGNGRRVYSDVSTAGITATSRSEEVQRRHCIQAED
jgi:hypothetical protein